MTAVRSWLARLAPLTQPDAPTLVYLALLLVAGGFVLLAVTWGNVAGYLDVGDQVPYLISGGFTGLGLVVVGMAVLAIAVLRREAARRRRDMAQLVSAVQELRSSLSER